MFGYLKRIVKCTVELYRRYDYGTSLYNSKLRFVVSTLKFRVLSLSRNKNMIVSGYWSRSGTSIFKVGKVHGMCVIRVKL